MRNPFKLIRDFFRKPAMIGTPPSKRSMWHDPAEHAKDFAKRYVDDLDLAVSQRMMDLGIPDNQIGKPNYGPGPLRLAFQPYGVDGGNIEANGEMIVDSGILNDDLLKRDYGRKAGKVFEQARLRDRLDAIIAHEFEEHRQGMDHDAALKFAPKTDLPISDRARRILLEMKRGWKGKSATGLFRWYPADRAR